MSGKELKRLLEQNGWHHVRTTGSHCIMEKEGFRLVPVPVHGNMDIGKGLLNKILKQTGLK